MFGQIMSAIGGLSGVGSVLGPVLGYMGQEAANDANVMLSRENRYHAEELANTQYQRAVSDMKAAGLNPALMFKQAAPSAVPNTSPAQVQSELGAGVTSAAQLGNLLATVEKTGAELGLIKAQEKNVQAQTVTEIAKPKNVEALTQLYGASSAKAIMESITEAERPSFVRAQTATEAVRPGEVISKMLHHDASAAALRERGRRDRVEADISETVGHGHAGREIGSFLSMTRALGDALQRSLRGN